MQNTKKLMFVHIPRTGGTSIRHVFKDKDYFFVHPQISSYIGHTPAFILETLIQLQDYYKIAVIRNPYTRAYSLYKSFIKQIDSIIPYPSLRNNQITFHEFLTYVRLQSSKQSPVTFNVAPNAIFDQSFYIFNSKGKNVIDRIYRYENLKELENDYSIKLPILNTSDSKRLKHDYVDEYTQENIDLVAYLYHRDFQLLNYSFDFKDTMEYNLKNFSSN